MAIAEILVSGGVAGVLAAVIGGGLRAFGTEVPVISSTRRQIQLLIAGAVFIVAGIWLGRPGAPPAPPPPRIVLEGSPSIDFRSSEKDDSLVIGSGRGYLLVTTVLSLRNPTDKRISWSVSGATLQVGGARIPFQPYYFTSLNDEVEPWLGPRPRAAGPGSLRGGEARPREIMFLPVDAGSGLYRWDSFLREVLENGQTNPVFTVTVTPRSGDVDGSPVSQRCVAQIDDLIEDLGAKVASKRQSVWITAGCAS